MRLDAGVVNGRMSFDSSHCVREGVMRRCVGIWREMGWGGQLGGPPIVRAEQFVALWRCSDLETHARLHDYEQQH